MNNILREISKKAIILNKYDFSSEQLEKKWLGFNPALEEEIKSKESSLGLKLPQDYLDFLRITNGFPQYRSTGVSFSPVDKIDFLKNVYEDLVEIWLCQEELIEVGQALSESIIIGGINEEQYFLLIPPCSTSSYWRYWFWASWSTGETEFSSLQEYLESELALLKNDTQDYNDPIPRPVVDNSLLEYLFKHEWKLAYQKAFEFSVEGKQYWYFQGMDLINIMLLCAYKLNSFQVFDSDLKILYESHPNGQLLRTHKPKLDIVIENSQGFMEEFQADKFEVSNNPKTIADIEKQVASVRPDLLKDKNAIAKLDYILYFLFAYGNDNQFIELFESSNMNLYYQNYYRAAIIYAIRGNINNAKKCLIQYYSFTLSPINPFLDKTLNNIMDKDFSSFIWDTLLKNYT